MEREAVSCHLDMETSSLFVATAAAADCILPTMRLWPPFFVVDLWLKGTLQPDVRPPYHHHHHRGDFLWKVSRLSLSSTDHTKIMSFFVCPIMFSIPFFWRLERIFFSLLLADFSETKDLFCAAAIFWKQLLGVASSGWCSAVLGILFFENAVTILRKVYFYHTSIFLENSFFHFHQRNHHLKGNTKVWVVTYINIRNIYIWLESFSFSIWEKVHTYFFFLQRFMHFI